MMTTNDSNKKINYADIITKEPIDTNHHGSGEFANIDHLALYRIELESLQNYLEAQIKEQDKRVNELEKICKEITRLKALISIKQDMIVKMEYQKQNEQQQQRQQ